MFDLEKIIQIANIRSTIENETITLHIDIKLNQIEEDCKQLYNALHNLRTLLNTDLEISVNEEGVEIYLINNDKLNVFYK